MTTRLVIATPIYGTPETATVHAGYHHAVRALERRGAEIIPHEIMFSDDICRARARCVDYALRRGFDWLMFWDSDVFPRDPSIVARMLERATVDGHHWLGAPYPRKRMPAMFPYRELPGKAALEVVRDCAEVEALAIGFTLISQWCLQKMWNHYRSTLWFSDWRGSPDGAFEPRELVDLFDFMREPERQVAGHRFREKLSEDYAACVRWRALGGKIQMYVGDGAPVAHIGSHVYTGRRDELGNNK